MAEQSSSAAADLVFSIPHVVASISLGLSHHDLTSCVGVCHSWNQIFSFEFLRRDSGRGSFRGVFMIQECNAMMTIRSKALNSKTRRTRKSIMSTIHYIDPWMDKKRYAVQLHGGGFYTSDDLVNNTGDHEVSGTADSQAFRALSDRVLPCTHIELHWFSSRMTTNSGKRNIMLDQVLERMADTVLALDLALVEDDLDISPYWFKDLALPASFPKRIGRLRALTSFSLVLGKEVATISDAFDRFFQECPNLKRFTFASTGDVSDVKDVMELSRILKNNCSRVTDLAFRSVYDFDAIVSFFPGSEHFPMVSHTTKRPLKKTIASEARQDQPRLQDLRAFSCEGAFPSQDHHSLTKALRSCCSTLECVETSGLRLLSHEIEFFLTQCPRLEHLSIHNIWYNDDISLLDISSFRSTTPWVCLGLKSIRLEIRDGCEHSGDCENWATHQKGLDPSLRFPHPDVLVIYQRLSQFTALESIQLALSHCDRVVEPSTRSSSISLISGWGLFKSLKTQKKLGGAKAVKSHLDFDFSLASGLDLLKTLKSLKRLSFFPCLTKRYQMAHRIEQVELEWMVDHWPDLQEIILGTLRPKKGSSEAEKWNWLKEAKPV